MGSTTLKEWTTPDCRNTPSTTNREEEQTVDAAGNDGNASMSEQVKRPNPWRKMMMMFISFLYMFRGIMCPLSGKTIVFMRHLLLVPPCISDSHPHRITCNKCRIYTVVSPDDGHIVAGNM